MKEEIRCGARIKVRGKWMQCTHEHGHSGRHWYQSKRRGYRSFTEAQARYWPVKAKKRKLYESHPSPIDAVFEMKLPHVYGGYHVDPKNGNDEGDGSPGRPLKTSEAAKLLYLKHGGRLELTPTEAFAKAAEGWREFLKVPDEALKKAFADEQTVIRVPVKYDYAAIHPEFLKMLAEIGSYADNKYGSWAQYLNARLTGNADPINHIYEHLRSFQMLERYDHFEGDPRRHLAAIAYNAMMSFAAFTKWGPAQSEYAKGVDMRPWPLPAPTEEVFRMTSDRFGVAAELTKPKPKKRRKKKRK